MAQITDPVLDGASMSSFVVEKFMPVDVVVRGLSVSYPTFWALTNPAFCRATSYPGAKIGSVRVAFSIRS